MTIEPPNSVLKGSVENVDEFVEGDRPLESLRLNSVERSMTPVSSSFTKHTELLVNPRKNTENMTDRRIRNTNFHIAAPANYGYNIVHRLEVAVETTLYSIEECRMKSELKRQFSRESESPTIERPKCPCFF